MIKIGHIEVEHEQHPAFAVIEKALNDWDIEGFPSVIQVEYKENAAQTLHNRNYDVPSVIDFIIEALIEEGLLTTLQE